MLWGRWFASRCLTFVAPCAVISIIALGGCPAAAEPRGLLSIDIHDGVPYAPILVASPSAIAGNFMTWVDTWGEGFIVQRMWFYHGGSYAESGVPYEIHLIERNRFEGGVEYFSLIASFQRETTCNYCWEETGPLYWSPIGGSNEESTFGVFIRPSSHGGALGGRPLLWRDRYANHTHLAALLNVYFGSGPAAAGDRDLYELNYYFSDYGQGEVLLGMEIESSVIVPTESSSFSAVKSLY